MNTPQPDGPCRYRVAVVAACTFPSPRGSQVLVRSVVEHLAAAGHEVHLLTYAGAGDYRPPEGVRVHATPARFGLPPAGLGWSKALHNLLLLGLLRRVVSDERIDVIHAHNYEAPLLAYWVRGRTGVPVVYHAHNALSDELATYLPKGWRRRLARWVGRRLDEQVPRRADHAIALTPELARFLVACGVDGERVSVLAPVDLPGEAVDVPPAERAGGGFVVTYAGNLDPYQDLDVLFAGFERLRRDCAAAVLEVVTHDADWRRRLTPRLDGWLAAGAVRVRVEAEYAGVLARMAAADVLVCPRSSWSGYPIKLVNYARAARPIVAAAGSAKGLVAEDSALVFADGDPEDLARALRRLHDEPDLAARLAVAARRRAGEVAGGAEFASHLGAIYGKIGNVRADLRGPGASSTSCLRRIPGGRISTWSSDGGQR